MSGNRTGRRLACATILAVLGAAAAGCVPVAGRGGGENGQSFGESGLGNYLAGRFARSERDAAAAAAFYEQALADDLDNETLLQRSLLLHLAQGQMDRARPLATRRVREHPKDAMAQIYLAVEDFRDGRYEQARQRLAGIERSRLAFVLQPVLLAWLEQAEGRPEAALSALAELEDQEGLASFREFHAALLNQVAGRTAAAAEAFAALGRLTANSDLRVAQAQAGLFASEQRWQEAERLLAEQLARVPDNAGIIQALAQARARSGPEAIVRNAREGAAEALYGSAASLSQERAGELARIYVHLALHLRPDFDGARLLLAELLERDQRWDEARAVYERIPRQSPHSWDARLRAALTFGRSERHEEAIERLRQLTGERPDDLLAATSLGDLLRGRERYAEAAAAYGRAIARLDTMEERHWSLLYARGIAHERAKQWPLAEADFQQALKLKPEQPLVLNYLGYSWIEQGIHLDRALKMVERAVEQRPNDGYIVDSLGWAHYRLGSWDRALRYLERAVELRPEDPVINDHLGDAFWRSGRRLEARFQWQRALQLKPDGELAEKIRRKLEDGLAPAEPSPAAR